MKLRLLLLTLMFSYSLTPKTTTLAQENVLQENFRQENFLNETSFVCGIANDKPATIAQTPKGDIPLIVWAIGDVDEYAYSPERRCQEASERFAYYAEEGSLQFITYAYYRGLPVICTAQYNGGSCNKRILFYLPMGSNPKDMLENMLNLYDSPPEENGIRLYVDLEEYLRNY